MSQPPVRRLLMTGDTVGGVWTYALDLAEALGSCGVEVLLASLGGLPDPAQRSAVARLPNVSLAESSYKLEWMGEPWADVAASGDWLLELEDRFAPDVVHLNSFGHGALAWHAPVVLTAHSCMYSWWSALRSGPPPSGWNRYRDLVRQSLAAVHTVTAPSRAMLRSLMQHYGTDLSHACVILNGRNTGHYRVAGKEPFVLTVGRLWDEAKNVAAVAHIAKQLPWPCYLAGEIQHPDGSAAQFTACELLGRLAPEDLAPWYARAAIYALPARYEPFGLSVLEAALSGCALVLGDIESLRELWGDAALFVPPDNPEALHRALSKLIADPGLRAAMAHRSTARAQVFTAERMAAGYLELYQSAMRVGSYACAS